VLENDDRNAIKRWMNHEDCYCRCELSFQTGLGNFEKIEKIDRRHNLIGGFTYMAGAAIGPGRIRLGGIGKTYLGELDGHVSDRVTRIQQMLTASSLETETVDNIISYLWCKVLVYAVINPVTALLKIKNGRLSCHTLIQKAPYHYPARYRGGN